MKVFLTGATGYIGSAIATALQSANHELSGLARSFTAEEKLRSHHIQPSRWTPGQIRPWALTDAQRSMGAFADALVLDQQVSAAKARQVLDWQPQTPSLFDELKGGAYAIR